MVQLTNFDKLRQDPKQQIKTAVAVTVSLKNEIVEPLDEMYGHRNKRSKLAASAEQLECNMVMSSPTHDLLEEPSPLGLRLKKSPSLLDLIQMRLSEGKTVSTSSFISSCIEKKELKSTTVVSVVDKMKASNFPASILRIGSWEYVSRYEGDLVAKCYYAKHKLVWEVLDGGLKNKIEIQWSDITALKANCIENGFETLDIMLARRPLFFRETNPQPRKHTLWQATSDFTEGQASIHRRHSLQCHQGLLNKHFEKLIQCDPRLKSLSLQPDRLLESSCFEPSCSEEQGKNEPNKCLEFDDDNHKLKENHVSSPLEIHDPKRLCVDTDPDDTSAMQMHHFHSSADENARRDNKSTRIRASMSKDYLVSHLEHCISEQMASGNRLFSSDCMPDKGMLEEWADYLLSDSHGFVSDEKSLISKVNSFNCLLQRDPSMENLQQSCRDFAENDNHKQPAGVSRKDSIGDFLSNFPRISSIPQHLQLFSIEENNDDDQDFF